MNGDVGLHVPIVAVHGGIDEMVSREGGGALEVEIESFDKEVFLLQLQLHHPDLRSAVGMLNVVIDALYLLAIDEALEVDLQLVEIPLAGLDADGASGGAKAVVIALDE